MPFHPSSGSIPQRLTSAFLLLIFLRISFSSIEIPFGKTFLFVGVFDLPLGKSRICPTLDLTIYSDPKYLDIVLAFAGDSTITRDLAIIKINSFFYK